MNPINACFAATILFVAALFASAAQPMPIEQFDKLAIPDQGDYVALLLQGAQKILVDAGKHDDLAKLNKLFSDVRPGDQVSIGILEFETNLANVRVLDAERYAKDHGVMRLEVEQAMALTIRRNGIVLTPAFMHVADGFRPKLPVAK